MKTRQVYFIVNYPKKTYAVKGMAKTLCGEKNMKAKERVTVMVCIAASGKKHPLYVVGKAKIVL